eukprot:s228_g22.t1
MASKVLVSPRNNRSIRQKSSKSISGSLDKSKFFQLILHSRAISSIISAGDDLPVSQDGREGRVGRECILRGSDLHSQRKCRQSISIGDLGCIQSCARTPQCFSVCFQQLQKSLLKPWFCRISQDFQLPASSAAGDVRCLFSNERAFAAVLADRSVVTWGMNDQGGDSSSVRHRLDGEVTRIAGTR